MNFTGVNDSFSGATIIGTGATLVASGSSIGDTSAVTVTGGPYLDALMKPSVRFQARVTTDLGASVLTIGGDGTSSTYDGVLSNGGLIMAGPGSLTLTNAGNLLPGSLRLSAWRPRHRGRWSS